MSTTSVSPQALAINGGSPVRATFLPYGRQSVDEADIAGRRGRAALGLADYWAEGR